MDNNMGNMDDGKFKHLDVNVIRKTLEEMFSSDKFKHPFGTRNLGNGIYSISSGQSIIYTTAAGVEEFNKALKENFENEKKKDEDREAS